MKPSDQPYIPVLLPTWTSQFRSSNLNFENGGARLLGGIFEPRYMLIFPTHYEIVTVGLRSSENVNGFDKLYIRAGGLKADVIQMDSSFSVLFFKNDASSTHALYDRYRWEAHHEQFKQQFQEMEFAPTATVDDLKTVFKQKLGRPFKRIKKS